MRINFAFLSKKNISDLQFYFDFCVFSSFVVDFLYLTIKIKICFYIQFFVYSYINLRYFRHLKPPTFSYTCHGTWRQLFLVDVDLILFYFNSFFVVAITNNIYFYLLNIVIIVIFKIKVLTSCKCFVKICKYMYLLIDKKNITKKILLQNYFITFLRSDSNSINL